MTNITENLLLITDSYKFSHHFQYPPGTTKLFAYLESRGGEYKHSVFFGLQYLLRRYFTKPVTHEDVDVARDFAAAHGVPFPEAGWRRVVDVHGGKIPLLIRAVPEGTVVPNKNVLMTVTSTDPELFWLVTWFETLLMRVWYPTTVATRSFECKKVIREFLEETSNDPEGEIGFKLHDFGSRGVSSHESAGVGGMAHLVNFMGTDTITGTLFAHKFYHAELPVGFSIPAMEHSTVISWGPQNESKSYHNMIENSPGGMVACVSDSYDIYEAVRNIWCDELHEVVKNSGKTIVIRPDSGDPSWVNLTLLRIMEQKIGMTTNTKGYKVLPKYFRLIQGDGNDSEEDIRRVLQTLKINGYSASNIAFGMGGGLLQKLDRDTLKFAYKVSALTVNGEEREVRKVPIDAPWKASKGGILDLVKENGEFKTVKVDPLNSSKYTNSEMNIYYRNGIFGGDSFEIIRERANAYSK